MKSIRPGCWGKRLVAFAAGATLLQTGGCAIDTDLLLTQIVELVLQSFVSSLTV